MKVVLRQICKRIIKHFTGLLMLTLAVLAYRFVKAPSLETLLPAVLAPYLIPLALFRLHNLFFPLTEGHSFIGTKYYSPWFTSYRLQEIFLSFPVFEKVLILIPGAFSFWLRLWGSKIGKQVFWTPNVEICDRSALDIGHGVFFGNRIFLSSHIVSRSTSSSSDKFILYFKKITIGSGSFIGAGSRIGPGVVIDPRVKLPFTTDLSINTKVTAETFKTESSQLKKEPLRA